MEDFIANNIGTYGPLAVFLMLMLSGIGISLGEDIIIIPAGYLVGTGQLGLAPTLIAAYIGVVASDCLWFAICHHYGTPLLHKRWLKRILHPRRLLQAKHQFEARGAWVIVVTRFIPGSRTTTITVAGMLQMPFWRFAVVTALCVLVTVPLQIGLGMLVAMGIAEMSIADALPRAIGLIMLVVALVLVVRLWRRHRAGGAPMPRAKARWLRRFRVPGLRRGHGSEGVVPVSGPRKPTAEQSQASQKKTAAASEGD